MEETMDLRLFRKANGITQLALAEYIGVTKQFISQVESGKVALPTDRLKKILDNDEWSLEEYHRLKENLEALKASVKEGKEIAVAGEYGDVPYKVPLLPIFAQAGHRVTDIYIKRNRQKVDDANRVVIDYIWGKVTVPDLTTRDGDVALL